MFGQQMGATGQDIDAEFQRVYEGLNTTMKAVGFHPCMFLDGETGACTVRSDVNLQWGDEVLDKCLACWNQNARRLMRLQRYTPKAMETAAKRLQHKTQRMKSGYVLTVGLSQKKLAGRPWHKTRNVRMHPDILYDGEDRDFSVLGIFFAVHCREVVA